MHLASWPMIEYSVIFIRTHCSILPMKAPIESASPRLILDYFTSISPRFTDTSSFLYIVNKTGRYQNEELILKHSRLIQNLIIKMANFFYQNDELLLYQNHELFLSKWRTSFYQISISLSRIHRSAWLSRIDYESTLAFEIDKKFVII